MKQSPIPAYVAFSVTAAAIAGGMAITGIRCAGARPAAVSSHRTVAASAAKPKTGTAPAAADSDPMQGRYTAGGVLTAEQRDPRHPEVFLWKLSATGMQVDHPGQAITGVMTGVSATLYQKGKPAAILRAPRAYGDNVQKQITATGGVVVNSISQAGRPDGRKLTADNAVWKAKTATQPDQLIARGHVVYTDSVTGTTIRCAELITDTRLKTVSASNGATDLAGAILKRKQ